jgi:hypothetical protein
MQISVARHSLGVSTGRTAGFGYSFTGSDVKGAKGWRWRCGSPRPSPHRRLEGWLICALGGRYGSIKLVRAGPLFARLEKPLYLAGDDKWRPGLGAGKNMRKENTMVYFKALLLLERPRPLRLHDFGTRRQPGHELCSRQHEFVDAEEFAPVRGHLAVELLDMDIQKALAKFRSVRWRSAIAAASSESRAVLAGSLARSLWLRSQKRVEAALSKPKSLRSSGRATHHAVASSEEKPVFSSMALSLAAPSTALSIDVIGNDPQARGLSARIAAEMIACKDAGVEAP